LAEPPEERSGRHSSLWLKLLEKMIEILAETAILAGNSLTLSCSSKQSMLCIVTPLGF